MTVRTPQQKLLVGLPKEFGFKKLFEESVHSVIKDLSSFDVTLIPDGHGISTRFFESVGVKLTTVTPPKSRLECLALLKKHSHLIVFWDGEALTDLVYFSKLLKFPARVFPVQITKVCNKDKGDSFDIYIGRGSPWGNPFPIEHHEGGDKRRDVIDKYRGYFKKQFLSNPETLKAVLSLRGMKLACHCKPMDCHGDVIAEFLNSYEG